MPSLSSSIIKQGIVSLRDIEEALMRQALRGGDLITNLLEMTNLREDPLPAVLAETYGLEPAPSGPLPAVSETVLTRIPTELALAHNIYPLAEDGDTLVVAVSEPLLPDILSRLSNNLGLIIEQRTAPLVRVREAVARHYGLPLDSRSRELIAKLDRATHPPSSHSAADKPTNANPLKFQAEPVPLHLAGGATRSPTPPSSPVHRAPSSRPSRASLVTPTAGPRTLTEAFPLATAEKTLKEAASRDAILGVLMEFSAQFFEYTVLFALHGDLAEGYAARGPGAPKDKVIGIGVSLDLPSALSAARDTPGYLLTRLASTGLDAALARDLERKPEQQVLLLPFRVRERTVFVLYGDRGAAPILVSQIGELLAFAPSVSRALEQLIVRKKRGISDNLLQKQTPILVPQPRRVTPMPKPEVRAATLLNAVRPSAPSAAPYTAPHPMQATPIVSLPVIIHDEQTPVAAIPVTQAFAQTADQHSTVFAAAPTEPELKIPPSTRHFPPSTTSQKEALEPATPSTQHAPSPSANSLLQQVIAGDKSVVDSVVALGEIAVAPLMAAFPGPIQTDTRRAGEGRASDAGPVLKALARLGSSVVPYLITRSAGEEPNVRKWAVRLLAEFSGTEPARAIARRFIDEDSEVRRAAVTASLGLERDTTSREAWILEMAELLRNANHSPELRARTTEALAAVRSGCAVPLLIELLGDSERTVAQSAAYGLHELTRQDLGPQPEAWRKWWEHNQQRHRIEWLIDALLHDNQDIRRAASEELKHLTREYFGYYDDLPRKERQKAQMRYREWWEAKGKQRFK